MLRDRVSVLAAVVAVLATLGVAYAAGFGPFGHDRPARSIPYGCWSDDTDCTPGAEDAPTVDAPAPAPDPDERKPFPPAVDGVHVLYDDTWTVEEGQWSLGDVWDFPEGEQGPDPSFTTMLESVGPEGAYLTVPGFYGRYRTRVELLDHRPAVPSWCEDAAEASIRFVGERPAFSMGSFETFSDAVAVPGGSYRVRYCTEKQDQAASQDEFTGEEYTVYAGRHLIQLWRDVRQPDRVLLTGSRWAKQLSHSDS